MMMTHGFQYSLRYSGPKVITLTVFMKIEGAFDYTWEESVENAAGNQGSIHYVCE